MSNFRLISHDLCPYVQRCVMTLREKEVVYDIDYIDLSDRPDWFVELSLWLLKTSPAKFWRPMFGPAVITENSVRSESRPPMSRAPLILPCK